MAAGGTAEAAGEPDAGAAGIDNGGAAMTADCEPAVGPELSAGCALGAGRELVAMPAHIAATSSPINVAMFSAISADSPPAPVW